MNRFRSKPVLVVLCLCCLALGLAAQTNDLDEKAERQFTYTDALILGLVEGITVASLLFLDTMLQHAWILIDEVSLIPIDTMGMLARAKLVGAKFVCFGDFEGQFDAMKDRWDRVRTIQDSECMKDMCNRMHFHLTTYWRSTDRAPFDFYTQLYCESDEELPFIVEQAQKTYPVKLSSPLEFDVVLCVSHANRMLVNRLQNEQKLAFTRGVIRPIMSNGPARISRAQPANLSQ